MSTRSRIPRKSEVAAHVIEPRRREAGAIIRHHQIHRVVGKPQRDVLPV